ATSGTGFAQIIAAEAQQNRQSNIMTLGIAEAANTTHLFERARQSRIQWTTDDRWITYPSEVGSAVAQLLDQVDLVYLTIDLDVLPAATAPGVSSPAAYGVPLPLVSAVIDHVACSGKLVHADIAELNLSFDRDNATAAVAARFVDRITNAERGKILATSVVSQRPKRVNRSEFKTTRTDDAAMAIPANIGFSKPKAATGMPKVL